MSVLVIEKDVCYAQQLRIKEADDGLNLGVHTAQDIEQGIAHIERYRPRIVILCLSHSNDGPANLCMALHRATSAPLLVITPPEQKESTISALRAGADECLIGPVGSRELRARIKALLRREPNPQETRRYNDGTLMIDISIQQTCRNGQPVHLSNLENHLLGLLLLRRGEAVAYKDLTDTLWPDMPPVPAQQQLAILVRSLRKKIEENPSRPRYVKTRRCEGYMFEPKEC